MRARVRADEQHDEKLAGCSSWGCAWPRTLRARSKCYSCASSQRKPKIASRRKVRILSPCLSHYRGHGATAARLTPDQKVGNSNLSGFILLFEGMRFALGCCQAGRQAGRQAGWQLSEVHKASQPHRLSNGCAPEPLCFRILRVVSCFAAAAESDPGRTRACNLWFRRPTPYPLGHRASDMLFVQPSDITKTRDHTFQTAAACYCHSVFAAERHPKGFYFFLSRAQRRL